MIYAGNRRRFRPGGVKAYRFLVLAQSVGKTPSPGLLGAGVGGGFDVALADSCLLLACAVMVNSRRFYGKEVVAY